MRMYDIIEKKRDGGELTEEEIRFFVDGCTSGDIPDYQTSALLMAIYLKGMTERETVSLTLAMATSGDTVDLSGIDGVTCDKHSTGGVGDKTTLVVAPMVVAMGGTVAKLSGRGLGHTGGTVDKLESIPGFRTSLSTQAFTALAKRNRICVAGQSGNLVPADKKIYALRDVTATVGSIPLIASSIMSKKLAAGSECIVLDVKVGSGSFMKDAAQARLLAETMVNIGKAAGRKMAAVLTDMDIPLGNAVGNILEVKEAIEVLNGRGPEDVREICSVLAANMVALFSGEEIDACILRAKKTLEDGSAMREFIRLVSGQGGDVDYVLSPEKFPEAEFTFDIKASSNGYISHINTETVGTVASVLGAGRISKDDSIDPCAGIVFKKKTGDAVCEGEIIATLYTDSPESIPLASELLLKAVDISAEKPNGTPIVIDVIK